MRWGKQNLGLAFRYWVWRRRSSALALGLTMVVLALCSSANSAPTSPTEVDLMGIPPIVALIGDGHISAGFSKAGKLVSFFYPTVGAYPMIPYSTSTFKDVDKELYGAPEHLGAFMGLADLGDTGSKLPAEARVNWLEHPTSFSRHPDEKFSSGFGFPVFDFKYQTREADLAVSVYAPAREDGDPPGCVVYEVTVTNTDPAARRMAFAYYGLFDPPLASAADKNQRAYIHTYGNEPFSGSGWVNKGTVRVGRESNKNLDALVWSKPENGNGDYAIGFASDICKGHPDRSVLYAETGVVDKGTVYASGDKSQRTDVGAFRERYLLPAPLAKSQLNMGPFPPGSLPITDAMHVWNTERNTSTLANGLMIWDLGLLPPQSPMTFQVFVVAARNRSGVVDRISSFTDNNPSLGQPTTNELFAATEQWWDVNLHQPLEARLNSCWPDAPSGIALSSPDDRKLLHWWVATMRLMADRDTGAIVACPTLIPQYYGAWPRDGTYQALVWTALGFQDIAGKFYKYLFDLRDFGNGKRWFQCYDSSHSSDAKYVGFPMGDLIDTIVGLPVSQVGVVDGYVLEEDQMPTVLLGLWYYRQAFGKLPDGLSSQQVQQLASFIRGEIIPGQGFPSLATEHHRESTEPVLGTVRRGLIWPSSDAYEFPGEVGGLINLTGPKALAKLLTPDSLAVRQASYTNYMGASGLNAASQLLNSSSKPVQPATLSVCSQFGLAGLALRKNSEAFYSGSFGKNHFAAYWSILGDNSFHDRPGDVSAAFTWPIQAYRWDDPKLKGHYSHAYRFYRGEAPGYPHDKKLFAAGALLVDIAGVLSSNNQGLPLLSAIRGNAINKGGVNNDYLPEFVEPWCFSSKGKPAWVPSTEPLGWAQAMGVMALLIEGGYRPPKLKWEFEPEEDKDNLLLVLDVSASMNGFTRSTGRPKLEAAKAAIRSLVHQIEGYDISIGLIAYSCQFGCGGRRGCTPDQMPVIVPFTKDRLVILAAVDSLMAENCTPQNQGIARAFAYAGMLPEAARCSIMLLGDGQQNCPQPETPALDDIITKWLGVGLRQRTTLSCIAFSADQQSLSSLLGGSSAKDKWISELGKLARQGGGVMVDSSSAELLSGAFRQLALAHCMPSKKLASCAILLGALLSLSMLSTALMRRA